MNTQDGSFSLMPYLLLVLTAVLTGIWLHTMGTLETAIAVANLIDTALTTVWYVIEALL